MLAAATLLWAADSALAESRGLVISGDSDSNVNINIDSSLVNYVDSRKKISIPKGENVDLSIDPALKKSGAISVESTATETIIKVNSDNVYFNIGEVVKPPEKAAMPEAPPAKKAAALAPQAATQEKSSKSSASTAKSVQPVVKESSAPVVPVSSSGLEAVMPSRLLAQPAKKAEAASGPPPKSLTEAMLKQAQAERLNSEGLATDTTSESDTPLPESSTEAELTNEIEQEVLENLGALPGGESAAADNIPLEVLNKERESRSIISLGLLAKLVGGLVVVLLAAVGVIKYVLPWAIQKYPQFFPAANAAEVAIGVSALRRKKASDELSASEEAPAVAEFAAAESSDTTPKAEAPFTSKKMTSKLAFLSTFGKKADPAEGKAAYLSHVGNRSDGFQVLASTPLGKNKELHLVEIRGRQLVIATTPYTINLIADLNDGADAAESVMQDTHQSSDEEMVEDYPTLPEPETIAYLEEKRPSLSQAPVQQNSAEDKSFAGKPFEKLANLAAERELYKKYLEPQENVGTSPKSPQQVAREQLRRTVVGLNGKHGVVSPASAPPLANQYVEAEEVVVLEDYDDVYRS